MANPTGSNQTLVKIYEQLLNAIRVAVVDSALPDGAATLAEQETQTALLTDIEANQDTGNTSLASIDSKLTAPITIDQKGKTSAHAPTRIDYTTVNGGAGVSTAAYTQLVASLSNAVTRLHIFDSSGTALLLAVGGAGSEVDQIYIEPGGTGPVDLAIASGSRVSIKAVGSAATKGQLLVSFLG